MDLWELKAILVSVVCHRTSRPTYRDLVSENVPPHPPHKKSLWVFPLHVCMCITWVQSLRRPEKGVGWILWNCGVTMWVPRIEPGSSARAASALNHWAIPQPHQFLFKSVSHLADKCHSKECSCDKVVVIGIWGVLCLLVCGRGYFFLPLKAAISSQTCWVDLGVQAPNSA